MSDDPSAQKTKSDTNGRTGDSQPEGTILGDNAGVYIPSREDDDPAEMPADFGSFVVSLGTNCMINLGRIEHPETGKTYADLESAMHTIEIIEMLEEKTEGNLDTEEQKLIESLLYDLRTAYVQEKKKAQGPTVKN
jgi:hypothetical protein